MGAGLLAFLALLALRGVMLLTGYLGSSSAFPQPLSAEEEREQISRLRAGDPEARARLIEHNLRLVAHIVKKFDGCGEDPEDLISIGTVGLIKGVEAFDPSKGTRLATFAARCIENEVLPPIPRASGRAQGPRPARRTTRWTRFRPRPRLRPIGRGVGRGPERGRGDRSPAAGGLPPVPADPARTARRPEACAPPEDRRIPAPLPEPPRPGRRGRSPRRGGDSQWRTRSDSWRPPRIRSAS